MLMDPRAESLVTNFAFQWLNIGHIDAVVPDPVLYPDFDLALRTGFREGDPPVPRRRAPAEP